MGNLQDFDADRLGFLTRAHAEHGPIASFDARTTLIGSADLAREVLSGPVGSFGIREDFLQRRLSRTDLVEREKVRTILNPGLRRGVAGSLGLQAAQRLVHLVANSPAGARASGLDPMPMLESAMAGAIAHHYFGDDGLELPKAGSDLLDALARVVGNSFSLPPGWGSPARRRIHRKYLHFNRLILPLLRARAHNPESYTDQASRLVRSAAERRLPLERLADVLTGALLAAQRVPASAGSWILMSLADHPVEQARVRRECPTEHVAPRGVSTHPGQPSSTTSFVLETLRLHPPTWLISRTSLRPVQVGGYAFDAGQTFLISPFVIHRDAAWFPSPDDFRVERWSGQAPDPSAYMPFGVGLHACPGTNAAMTMLVAITEAVTSRYRVGRRPGFVVPDPRTTLLPRELAITFADT